MRRTLPAVYADVYSAKSCKTLPRCLLKNTAPKYCVTAAWQIAHNRKETPDKGSIRQLVCWSSPPSVQVNYDIHSSTLKEMPKSKGWHHKPRLHLQCKGVMTVKVEQCACIHCCIPLSTCGFCSKTLAVLQGPVCTGRDELPKRQKRLNSARCGSKGRWKARQWAHNCRGTDTLPGE